MRTFRLFERWHKSTTRYDDGTPLPEEHGSNPAEPGVVALRGGGTAAPTIEGRSGSFRGLVFFYFCQSCSSQPPSVRIAVMNEPPRSQP